MKIPRTVQHAALVAGSLLLVVFAIEGISSLILRTSRPPTYNEPRFSGDIWTFDEARGMANDSELARLILSYEDRLNNQEYTSEERQLQGEPPVFLPSAKGNYLWKSPQEVSPNLNENFVVKGALSGKTKYEVQYTTDRHGRRLGYPGTGENILFLGCSYTFGQGVNNEETFPYYVGKKMNARTFNAGIPGASLTTFLQRIRSSDFPGTLPDEDTTVVLTLIPEHLIRTIGTMSFFRNSSNFTQYPYAVEKDGRIEIYDSFADDPTYKKHFLNILAQTSFVQAFNLEYPSIEKDQLYFMARIIREMESELLKKYPRLKRFAVSFYPAGNARQVFRDFRDVLIRENIEVFDYTFINGMALFRESFFLKYDSHPSPLAYEFYSHLLISKLTRN